MEDYDDLRVLYDGPLPGSFGPPTEFESLWERMEEKYGDLFFHNIGGAAHFGRRLDAVLLTPAKSKGEMIQRLRDFARDFNF
jgi:hypothetical protein